MESLFGRFDVFSLMHLLFLGYLYCLFRKDSWQGVMWWIAGAIEICDTDTLDLEKPLNKILNTIAKEHTLILSIFKCL